MRRFDLLTEYSTVISPALTSRPGQSGLDAAKPRHVPPVPPTGRDALPVWLRSAASLVISVALIAVIQL